MKTGAGARDVSVSPKQLQVGNHVDLVLSRELHREITIIREQVRVERGDLFQRFRAVVVKVGSGLPHTPQRRDLEGVAVLVFSLCAR